MALPTAPLGNSPLINLGGYIPAARRDPKLLEQVLAAFLGGMANTASSRVVDQVLPDSRVAAENDYREKVFSQQKTAQEAEQEYRKKVFDESVRANSARDAAEQRRFGLEERRTNAQIASQEAAEKAARVKAAQDAMTQYLNFTGGLQESLRAGQLQRDLLGMRLKAAEPMSDAEQKLRKEQAQALMYENQRTQEVLDKRAREEAATIAAKRAAEEERARRKQLLQESWRNANPTSALEAFMNNMQ